MFTVFLFELFYFVAAGKNQWPTLSLNKICIEIHWVVYLDLCASHSWQCILCNDYFIFFFAFFRCLCWFTGLHLKKNKRRETAYLESVWTIVATILVEAPLPLLLLFVFYYNKTSCSMHFANERRNKKMQCRSIQREKKNESCKTYKICKHRSIHARNAKYV